MTGRTRRLSLATSQGIPPMNLQATRHLMDGAFSAIVPYHRGVNNFADLQSDVANRLQTLKADIDRDQTTLMKQLHVESAKLKKRSKNEKQNFTTICEAIEIDWKNFLLDCEDDARENQTLMEEINSKLNNSTSHFLNTCVPELRKSVEKTINDLKSHYVRSTKADPSASP